MYRPKKKLIFFGGTQQPFDLSTTATTACKMKKKIDESSSTVDTSKIHFTLVIETEEKIRVRKHSTTFDDATVALNSKEVKILVPTPGIEPGPRR